ncbi:ethanolamine utilization protein EutH [Pseudoramibacter faecis]|uniref:ethanolamine utilization protein EutH n=1 Tax=Pseudoramibacter faecis TaxID=3108534 RepID=UPI002E7644D6|nr:ethanolamine utilization protein EutH [Pseudoramibacter sp. HA2172]
MAANQIIVFVMACFMLWGAVDKVFLNNRFGYGSDFDEGLNMMGTLAASMLGFMCLAPVIGRGLKPMMTPIFRAIGADPAMCAGSVLPIDIGGYALAKALTNDPQIQALSGIILGSMLGATVLYNIPLSLALVRKRHHRFLARGTMLGVITAPIGTFFGALIGGIPAAKILTNIAPATLLALLLTLGLWRKPEVLLKGFAVFSRLIMSLSVISLACAIFTELTGIAIIPGMDSLKPQFIIVGRIAITLAGAFPFIRFLTRIFSKQLSDIGRWMGVNEATVAGMLASLANSIPAYKMLDAMDDRGKVVALAFLTPGAYCLAGQMAFAAANAPAYVIPMIAAKLIAGTLAAALAVLSIRFSRNR